MLAVPGIMYSLYYVQDACCIWYSVQYIYVCRKGCLLYLCKYVQKRLPAVPGITYSVYMYRKGCLLYLVFWPVCICTGKVACCTWYSVQCIYVQERLPAVPGILYSVHMYRKGCLLYLVFCGCILTGLGAMTCVLYWKLGFDGGKYHHFINYIFILEN